MTEQCPRCAGVRTARIEADSPRGWCRDCDIRHERGWCTYKQAQLLRRYGRDTQGMTCRQAADIIDDIKANNWQPLTHKRCQHDT